MFLLKFLTSFKDKYGFNLKRSEQIEGVKRILMMEDVNKRSSMVKILLDKIFKVAIICIKNIE